MNNSTKNKGPFWLWPLGISVGTILTGALYLGVIALIDVARNDSVLNTVGLPSFFFVPICGGVAASYCWKRLDPGLGSIAIATLVITCLTLGIAMVAIGEGVICLLIVSPLFYIALFTGAAIGRIWFRNRPGGSQWCLLPVLALAATGEPFTRSNEAGVVVDEIRIAAPPAKVWPELTSFPDIQTAPEFWLFRLGLPYPISTTSGGDYVGAGRQCIFSSGMVFEEKVVTCDPLQNLTFDITKLPEHPELIGHITPGRGQFLLRDNGDGSTTLIGSTWYTLHVRPLWYFNWWTEQIFRAVHLRVMNDIRQRAERG